MALVGPVGPSFLSGPSGPNEPSVRPRGAERGGPYPLKPRILGSNTMTRLLEAGPLPALLFEPTFGRVGLDRVQYARPMATYALRLRGGGHGRLPYKRSLWTEGVLWRRVRA